MAIDFPDSPVTGQLFEDGGKSWRFDGEKWVVYATIVVVDSTPVGSLQAFAGAVAPTGWMLAHGQAISRETFSGLFSVIGTTYGVGDGSTTFNLPDLRGRVVAGLDNMGGSGASRLTGQTGGVDGDVMGGTGGAETHTLTTAQMPSHNHTQRSGASLNVTGGVNSGLAYDHFGSTIDSNMVTANTGGGGAHNNVQPTIVLNYIIKYGPSSRINAADDQFVIPTQVFS